MKIFKTAVIVTAIITFTYAQKKESIIGFYVKPGIGFISKNSFTQNTNGKTAFDIGGGMLFVLNTKRTLSLCLEYTNSRCYGRDNDNNILQTYNVNTARLGFNNLLFINDEIGLRALTGVSLSKSYNISNMLWGYYIGLGIEHKISEKGVSYFFDLQYDLLNSQNETLSGNLGGVKIFLGLKYIKIHY